jgi:acetoacetate decarboxylase
MSPMLAMGDSVAASANPLDAVRGRVSPDRGRFMMPAHFGPLVRPPAEFLSSGIAGSLYRDVSQIFLTHFTDGEMLSRFLPAPFELSREPLVTVNYSMNKGVKWLAGGSYNIIGVFVPATYKGKEQVSGSYAMVLWESLTDPILTGRESQGIPKIYGDVEDHQVSGDSWRTSLSRNGHKIVVSYATAFPTEASFRQAWTAQGRLEWHHQTWAQNPTQSHIVNAMQSLPVKEIRSCIATAGTVTLFSSKERRLS